jgi:hypothetical protein
MESTIFGILKAVKYESAPAMLEASQGAAPNERTVQMQDDFTPSIPLGLCQCGCGQNTTVPRKSNVHFGYTRGVPLRYVHGHNQIGRCIADIPPPNPSGLCLCGCGQPTSIATKTDTAVPQLKGHPNRYVTGHAGRLSPFEYIQEERGFVTPCWVWQRSLDGHGYGATGQGKSHRVMYERCVGEIPEGLELDHLCRQSDCCNPEHLEPVTGQVNVQRGAAAKLTADDVREIRAMASTFSMRETGRRLGVSHKAISDVLHGRTWGNIK